MVQNQSYNATIHKIKYITKDLAIFYIKQDEELFQHLPGQYVSIGLYDERFDPPKLIKRPYSVSSSFNDDEKYLELYIALVKDGAFTPLLFKQEVGNRIYVTPKIFGHYLLPPLEKDQTIIFASTGTGIAPHLSMLNDALKSCKQVILIDCVRYLVDLGYAEEIKRLESKHENLTYIPIATRENSSKRYIQDYFEQNILKSEYDIQIDPNSTLVFACGNPKMIGIPKRDRETGEYTFPEEKGLIEILMKKYSLRINKKNDPGQIFFEKYW